MVQTQVGYAVLTKIKTCETARRNCSKFYQINNESLFNKRKIHTKNAIRQSGRKRLRFSMLGQ